MNAENTNDNTATEGCAPAAGSGKCCGCDEYPATWTRRYHTIAGEPLTRRYCWMCREDLRDLINKGVIKVVWDDAQWTKDVSQNSTSSATSGASS